MSSHKPRARSPSLDIQQLNFEVACRDRLSPGRQRRQQRKLTDLYQQVLLPELLRGLKQRLGAAVDPLVIIPQLSFDLGRVDSESDPSCWARHCRKVLRSQLRRIALPATAISAPVSAADSEANRTEKGGLTIGQCRQWLSAFMETGQPPWWAQSGTHHFRDLVAMAQRRDPPVAGAPGALTVWRGQGFAGAGGYHYPGVEFTRLLAWISPAWHGELIAAQTQGAAQGQADPAAMPVPGATVQWWRVFQAFDRFTKQLGPQAALCPGQGSGIAGRGRWSRSGIAMA